MAFVITSPCIDEKAADCVEVCPVDAIHDAGETYLIDPDTCIDCGACEPVCPVSAIFQDDFVPDTEQEWIAKNREFFSK
ncbi:4Fe-4S dicluster domain-containing protein [Alicyclobacillaceae bacterium I2511]|nr:4Fe-4S dicluster domain-containing protein [Alicyclobacillaceae bacterium I2511]